MSGIEGALQSLGRLDLFARGDSPLHRLDPRVKIVTTIVFVGCVLSFQRYETTGLLPFFYFPVLSVAVAGLPPGFVISRLFFVAPFVLFLALCNPFFDRALILPFGPWQLAAGWHSFFSILLRFALTAGAVVVLVATSGMARICRAAGQMGVPQSITAQILLLYRYLFVIMEEALLLVRAHRLRAAGRRISPAVFRQLVGGLFLRTLGRAERIHCAMRCRGFDGALRLCGPDGVVQFQDWLFVLGNGALFFFFRFVSLPELMGGLLLGLMP